MTSQNQKSHCTLEHEGDKVPVSALEYTATTNENDKVHKMTQKRDLHLITPLFLIWFFPLIDLTNISLETDLHLTGNRFNVPLIVFFIPSTIFEALSDLGVKRTSPRVWFSG